MEPCHDGGGGGEECIEYTVYPVNKGIDAFIGRLPIVDRHWRKDQINDSSPFLPLSLIINPLPGSMQQFDNGDNIYLQLIFLI